MTLEQLKSKAKEESLRENPEIISNFVDKIKTAILIDGVHNFEISTGVSEGVISKLNDLNIPNYLVTENFGVAYITVSNSFNVLYNHEIQR